MFDAAKAVLLKRYINSNFKKYGRVIELDLDSRSQRLEAVFEVKGEDGEWIAKARYRIRDDGNNGMEVGITSATSSNPAVAALLKKHITGKWFDVPPSLGGWL